MLRTKENKGITLVALVVTIIILLILAGISISMLTGDNSIITQAGSAKTYEWFWSGDNGYEISIMFVVCK